MDSLLTGQQIIAQLRAEKEYLNKTFGVVDIGLFGSFAGGQPSQDSDIDLFVELKEPRFDWIAGLQVYLEKSLVEKSNWCEKGTRRISVS